MPARRTNDPVLPDIRQANTYWFPRNSAVPGILVFFTTGGSLRSNGHFTKQGLASASSTLFKCPSRKRTTSLPVGPVMCLARPPMTTPGASRSRSLIFGGDVA